MAKLALILWLWLPLGVLADGKIFPPTAFPEHVNIPEQEALIHWSNGVERLVIETRFDATGSNFAWVVPLPAPPKIEAATPGVFPTLRMYFAPEVRHTFHRWYLWVLLAASLLGMLATLESPNRPRWSDAALSAAFALPHAMAVPGNHILAGMFAFWLALLSVSLVGAARDTRRFWSVAIGIAFGVVSLANLALIWAITREPMFSGSRAAFARELMWFFGIPAAISVIALVTILAVPAALRKRVGLCSALVMLEYFLIFYFMPTGLGQPVAAAASSAGTTANPVAVLERKIVGSYETSVIQSKDPRALQDWFKTNGYAMPAAAEPVIADYVRDGWVFVATKLRPDPASGGKNVVHPLAFQFPTPTPVYPMRLTGVESGPVRVVLYVFGAERAEADGFRVAHCEQPAFSIVDKGEHKRPASRAHGMDIQHPLVRKWVDGSTVATKLEATLDPAAMRRDVTIRWTSFKPDRTVFFSRLGAFTFALNLASIIAFLGIALGAWIFRTPEKRARLLPWSCKVSALSLFAFAVIYLALPTISARAVSGPGYRAFFSVRNLHTLVSRDSSTTPPPDVAAIRARIKKALLEEATFFANPLQGGVIREEDSPGNFLLRKTPAGVELIFIDIDGGEWVIGSVPPKRD